ncbi:MAG: homoserine dehydrogenase [Lachnospiraceae bacterium]|nr:homoserine dehydrogenase [Lachnospiraceae bacterium]
MIGVAVMGYGTIGSGVVDALETNREVVKRKVGDDVVVKAVLDLRDFPGQPIESRIVHDFAKIVDDPEIQIVVETMGGLEPAYTYVKACILAGKQVTTSNKALVAAHGTELLALARERGQNFMFEASVGGGIPIIRPFYRSFAGERVEEITGILNGTTNYILTKMNEDGESFESALSEAQRLGYAERDPSADVEGHDTCRKIAILAALATGREVDYQKIPTTGISGIGTLDFEYAKKLKKSIKLLGECRLVGAGPADGSGGAGQSAGGGSKAASATGLGQAGSGPANGAVAGAASGQAGGGAVAAPVCVSSAVRVEGNRCDVAYAEGEETVYASVEPALVDVNSPLYAINDVYNGIMVRGNMLGVSMFYGMGAGKYPTASAVVSDVIEMANHLKTYIRIGWTGPQMDVEPLGALPYPYFVRLKGHATELFGDGDAGKDWQTVSSVKPGEFGVVTPPLAKAALDEWLGSLAAKPGGDGAVLQVIRVA